MKKTLLTYLLFIAALSLCQNALAQRYWVSAGSSNWNNTANWSISSGGAGGASVPGVSDLAVFNANGLGNCTLDIAANVAGITVNGYTGILNINGFNLTTTGTNTFTTGTINNGGGAAAVTLNTTATTTFSGTVFGANVNGSTGRIFFNGSTFNGTVTVTKTDNNNDNSTGNNIFNGVTTITNLGGGYILLGNGNPDQFNASTTFNNNGSYRFYFAHNHSGQTTSFASNVILNTNKSGGVDGWSFLIAESANTNVSFGGNLTINCAGTLQSNHRILQGNSSSATYSGTVTINDTNSNASTIIYMGTNGTSTYNNNISVSNSGGAAGIYFNDNASASSSLATTRTISIGGAGYSSGILSLERFTQLGTTPQVLNTFTGTTRLDIGPDAAFGGDVNFSAPQLYLNGAIYNGTSSLEKTGAGNDTGAGNNTFSSTATIINNGTGVLRTSGNNTFNGITNITNNATSDILLELSSGSIYNGDVTFTNTNSSYIRVAYNGSTLFNGNINVNSNNGLGIYFSENASGNATLAASKTISVGGGGFTNSTLSLPRFSQVGVTAQALTLTNTARLIVGPTTSFDGAVNFAAPRIFLNGCTFGGSAQLEKTGATDDASTGGNIFLGVTTITNSGSGEIFLGNTNGDSFGDITTFNNTGSYRIRVAYNHNGQATTFANNVIFNSNKSGGADPWSFFLCEGTNTAAIFNGSLTLNVAGALRSDFRFLNGAGSLATFNGPVVINMTNTDPSTVVTMGQNGISTYNGNITVTNTGGAAGINFNNSASASSTLTGSISISGGFSSGSLNLYRFNQVGAINHNLTLTNGAALRVGPDSEFDGNVNFIAPQLFLNGCVYQGTGSFEKTDATNDTGTGGNIFTGVTTITNSGSGYLLLGNGNRDQFLSATTFNNTGSSRIYFSHNHSGQTTTFASDVILNSNKSSGTDAYSFLVAEGSNTNVSFGGSVTINCAGTIRSDHQFLNGTGSSAVFSGSLNINVTNSNPSTTINMGINGTSTYNGNIAVLNSGGASGITFNSGASSSSILNGAITSGVFSSGSLNLYRFTQIGVIPENITLTNGAILRLGPNSSFDGNVNFVAPRLYLNGAMYNGTAYIEKNGSGDDVGNGGNIFNGTTTLVDSGSGYLMTANSSPDIFNGALTVTNSGSNWIYLAHNVTGNQFNNNITVNNTGSANGILFSNNASGAATFTNGTIAVGGSGFSVGDLRLRRFTQAGAIAQNLTLAGSARLWIGPDSGFDGNVNFVAPQLLLNGATYNGTSYLEKNGATNDDGTGPNIFNGATTIVNSGSNYLLTASTSPDIFNGNLVVTNSGSSTIRIADNSAGNQFNGNIEVNSTFGGGIYFGNSANGTSTLASGKTIAVGTTGVISGDIRLIRFTQVGPTPQMLNLSGIAILTLGPTSNFGGNVDFRSPQLLLNGTTYNGTAYLEKTGAGNNAGNGGNIFSGTTSIVNSGSGQLFTANASPDFFNGNLTVTNTGSNVIYLAHNVTGSQFNGNITFESSLGSGGIYIANNVTGDATLANGVSLLTGGLGFSSGELRFRRFTQIGTAAQTLLLTGTSLLRIGPSTTFNGNLDFRAPQFALDGSIYNGITYLEKTGATNNDSPGGNTFNGTTTIANSGSGFFRFALSALDTFNGDLTLSNTGSSTIRMADNTPGTVFNGNITVNSTFGGGIYFSESGGGTASLASGRTISVGGLGFSLGELRLRRFTQNGGTPQNLVFTGTAGLILGPSIIFNGAVDFRAPQLFIVGGSYNNTAYLEKTGATDNSSTGNSTFNAATTIRNSGTGYLRTDGNNTFNGATTLENSGSNYLLLELTTASTYNGNLTLTNTGSSNIRMSYAGNTAFNGNIVVNSTSGTGIYFSESGTGTATLATGRTISVGGTGFTAGELRLQRFTQTGATAQNIVLTGSSTFRSGPSATWNGALIVSSPALFLDGSILNGAANSLIKTGASTDSSIGGNTIGGNTTFTNSGTGVFRFANTTADDFTGNVTFNQASGTIQPAYNVASTFSGNVTVDGASPITFGANNGTITFAGNAAQNVIKSGTASPIFRRLLMSKSGNSVTLATDVSITTNATFTTGVLNTTTANILNFVNGSTVTGGSNASHIDGPVVKIGNAAFSFPTGDNGIYRPISISAPTTNTHAFRAEYFKAGQAFGGSATYPAGILTVSSCEYWLLDRTLGTSNVNVTLSWNSPDCTGAYITNLPTLRVVRWNGTAWVDHGNGGTTGNATAGTLITSAPITSFSPITLGSTTLSNPLPVELISFTGQVLNEQVKLNWITASELNNDFFTIQRSVDGAEFESIAEIDGAGTIQTATEYEFIDTNPHPNLSYYRLRQTDFDKKFTYSKVIAVNVSLGEELYMHPNPVSIGTLLTLNRKGDYIILNNLGVTVLKVTGVNQIDISTLAPGVYTLRSSKGDIKRLVIQ